MQLGAAARAAADDSAAVRRARVVPLKGRRRVGLIRPTSVAIGPDGAIYISHRGISVGIGEVLRIRP